MGVRRKKILGRQGASASTCDRAAARPAVDSTSRGHAEAKKTQLPTNVSLVGAATPRTAALASRASATAPASVASMRAASHRRGREKSRKRTGRAAFALSPGIVTTTLAHFEDDPATNMSLQLLLLQQAAPRLGPQPTLLCYPPFLCAAQGVASALLPFSADCSNSSCTAAAAATRRGSASVAALPPSATFFPVRHAQLQKATAESEKRRIAENIDAASRLAASLPHALFEVLLPLCSHQKHPQQLQLQAHQHQHNHKQSHTQQGAQGRGKRQMQQHGQPGATSSQSNDVSFQHFLRTFAAAAEETLQQMRHCDCCGLPVAPSTAAAQRIENLQPQGVVQADNAGDGSCVDEITRQERGVGEGTAATPRDLPAAAAAALCVIPVLQPSTRCILITPPKRVCLRCLQILHLPQLLGLSVASILSPQTSPLSKAAFSDTFSHFARVNGLSLDEDDSHQLEPHGPRRRSAGICLQQAIAAAFGVAALRRRMRWRVKAAFGTSLEDFFSHVSSSAVSLPGKLVEGKHPLQSSNSGSKKGANGTSYTNSSGDAGARDSRDANRRKKRKKNIGGTGIDAQHLEDEHRKKRQVGTRGILQASKM